MSTAAIPGSSQFGPTPNLREALSAIRNNSSLTQEQKAEMLEQTVRQWHQAQVGARSTHFLFPHFLLLIALRRTA